jgi:hypothetical protein
LKICLHFPVSKVNSTQNLFNATSTMDNLVIIMPFGVKFRDLCLILDFAYLGQAQVPHESLDDFLKAGELLQIRGIKERRLNFVTAQPQPSMNRSFDSTISSTQETFTQPPAKRSREDDDITIQEASEIMKMLLENNLEIETEVQELTEVPANPPPVPTFLSKTTMMQAPAVSYYTAPLPKAIVPKKKPANMGKKTQDKEKFPCRYCNRPLASKGRVTKHENECNDNPRREIVNCEICNMELKPSAYTLHKNTKHGGAKSQANSPVYTSQPSASPMNPAASPMHINSPNPMTVSDTASKSPIDPLMTMSPELSPVGSILSPAVPLQILKVEKIETINEEASVKMEKVQ